jgi:hypothetical protein
MLLKIHLQSLGMLMYMIGVWLILTPLMLPQALLLWMKQEQIQSTMALKCGRHTVISCTRVVATLASIPELFLLLLVLAHRRHPARDQGLILSLAHRV